jgi:aryl-alcohol dehydrogenase-like predicted oxidoreductase
MSSAVPRATLAPGYSISRVLKGGWQLAGGHGVVDASAALDDMDAFVAHGVTTFDCADIYTGVETLIGQYLRRVRNRDGTAAAARIQVHTKCVPDLDRLAHLTKGDIDAVITRCLARLGVDAIDLVQLHWWDYAAGDVMAAARWLDERRVAGQVRHFGLTNFDTAHVRAFVEAGVPVVSHQVQYSLLDRRPETSMVPLCSVHGIGLIAYGALAGGFLSERWRSRPAPAEPLENRSLVKYRLIIDECGGWDYLQALLAVMHDIATKHGVGLGAIAVRWVLDRPGVAGVIVGARHAGHLPDILAACDVTLDAGDLARLAAVQASATGPTGEVYGLEREWGGRHAAIMRYNLQQP